MPRQSGSRQAFDSTGRRMAGLLPASAHLSAPEKTSPPSLWRRFSVPRGHKLRKDTLQRPLPCAGGVFSAGIILVMPAPQAFFRMRGQKKGGGKTVALFSSCKGAYRPDQ